MIYLVSGQKYLFEDIKQISIEQSIEILSSMNRLEVDTETTGLDCHSDKILLLQFGNFDIQIVIDCTSIDILKYKEILETKDLILQNAKFDLKFLYKYNIIPKGRLWDTMLAEQVLYNGLDLPSNLAYLTEKYCKVTLDKEIRSNIPKLGITYDVIIYASKDVKYLSKIREAQYKYAIQQRIIKAIDLENKFVKVLAYVEFCGIYLNRDKWIKKYSNAKDELEKAIELLDNYVIDNNLSKYIDKQLDLFSTKSKTIINWGSTKQVMPLFKDIGINVYSPDNKSGESIAEKVIIKQKDSFDIIPIYLKYQGIKKDFTTYGENFLNNIHPVTGRIHSDFTQLMITSRLSSSNPNLQNLPADERTRSCFVPSSTDNILVIADYDGQEDKVFVNRSKEKKMIEFYKMEGADGHSYVASLCFPDEIGNTPLEEIKSKFKKLRQIAKSAKFAIHYSGTGYTIANNLNLSEEEGDRIYNAYLKAFPDISKYLKSKQDSAKKSGIIVTSTITNRKVFCKDFNYLQESGNFKKLYEFGKLACNFPIQTESAEITKIAGILFFEWILENNYFNTIKISNMIHDEIFIECPIALAELVSSKLKEYMEQAGSYYCKIVPLTATPQITDKWEH